jgi:hypothetical protein
MVGVRVAKLGTIGTGGNQFADETVDEDHRRDCRRYQDASAKAQRCRSFELQCSPEPACATCPISSET